MAASDSGVESNADAELVDAQKEAAVCSSSRPATAATTAATAVTAATAAAAAAAASSTVVASSSSPQASAAIADSRNAVVSPSESSTSDVSSGAARRRGSPPTEAKGEPADEEMEEDDIDEVEVRRRARKQSKTPLERALQEIEHESEEDVYRHHSSAGEETSASFERAARPADCIVCGVCRRRFLLNEFETYVDHKTISECRAGGKQSPSNESTLSRSESPPRARRREASGGGLPKAARSLSTSASTAREVATETDAAGEQILKCANAR